MQLGISPPTILLAPCRLIYSFFILSSPYVAIIPNSKYKFDQTSGLTTRICAGKKVGRFIRFFAKSEVTSYMLYIPLG